MEANKAPNDMSDKREKDLEKARQYLVAIENAGKSLPEILIGFAHQEKQQHLEDVLDKVEKEKIKECQTCSCQPPYTRCLGFDDALNHLKQRKG